MSLPPPPSSVRLISSESNAVANTFALRVPGFSCFGCSPANPSGLQLRFVRDSESTESSASGFDIVHTLPFTIPNHLQSFPGIAHGAGALGTVIDDCAYWCIYANTQALALTTKMNIEFVRPASVSLSSPQLTSAPESVDAVYVASARIDSFDRKAHKAMVSVAVRLVESGEEKHANSTRPAAGEDNAASDTTTWPIVCFGNAEFYLPVNNAALGRVMGPVVNDLPAAKL